MSDWQAGDLALCVRGGFRGGLGHNDAYPVAGRVYTVSDTSVVNFFVSGRSLGPWLKGGPLNLGDPVWSATRFIKVTPPTQETEQRREAEAYTAA